MSSTKVADQTLGNNSNFDLKIDFHMGKATKATARTTTRASRLTRQEGTTPTYMVLTLPRIQTIPRKNTMMKMKKPAANDEADG